MGFLLKEFRSLFSAASKAIQLKCLSDDEDSTDPDAVC